MAKKGKLKVFVGTMQDGSRTKRALVIAVSKKLAKSALKGEASTLVPEPIVAVSRVKVKPHFVQILSEKVNEEQKES